MTRSVFPHPKSGTRPAQRAAEESTLGGLVGFFFSAFFRLTIKLGGIRSAEGWYEDQLGSLGL